MDTMMDELDPDAYTIAWIAPLEIEAKAALAMLDSRHDGFFPVDRGDDYIYWAGDMRGHNVVIGTLPEGQEYGNAAAAALASQMKARFRNIWLGLLVGVAAGLPKLRGGMTRDIRLGDVLVAVPDGDTTPALVAYELGKVTEDDFSLLRSGRALVRTEPIISSAIKHIKVEAPDDAALFLPFYHTMKHKHRFSDPGQDQDTLYDIEDDGPPREIQRPVRPQHERTRVWYGPVGSGDKLLKNTKRRNQLRDRYGIIGLEMEAAGAINRLPVGVFRGVCDYGDERKNKQWQPYAAAMAAAYAKAILYRIRPKLASQNDHHSVPTQVESRDACLRSLAFSGMDFRFHDVRKAEHGTCDWVLKHDTYTKWISTLHGLLWIKGKPGSGKSTALKHIIRHMRTISPADHKVLYLTFFFHGRGVNLQNTVEGLFRSLLHQLLSQYPDACPQITSEFEQKSRTRGESEHTWSWHAAELEEYLRLAMLKVMETRHVFLFVDALDEAGKDIASQVVKYFKLLLQNLSPESDSKLHICFTCRHFPILERVSQFEIRVEDGNASDIETLVQSKLSESHKLCQDGFVQLITRRANGVFLWAKFVSQLAADLDSYGHNAEAIKLQIDKTPSEMEDIYDRLLQNIEDKKLALRLFYWVTFSLRSLSLDELRWPLTIDMSDAPRSLTQYQMSSEYVPDAEAMARKVLFLGRGLVEIVSTEPRGVQFIHETARHYIIETGLASLSTSLGMPMAIFSRNDMYAAHHRLAKTCLRYLAAHEIDQFSISRKPTKEESRKIQNHPLCSFMWYAVEYWVDHALRGEKSECCPGNLLDDFGWSTRDLVWRCIVIARNKKEQWRFWRWNSYSSYHTIHLLVALDLPKALNIAISRHPLGVNRVLDIEHLTPLALAAKLGRTRGIETLIDSGKADMNCQDSYGRTPLMLATLKYDKSCLRLLVRAKGVDLNAKDHEGMTALSHTANRETDAVAHVKELLSVEGIDVNAANMFGMTALHIAAAHGHKRVLKELVALAAADVNAVNMSGMTALHIAATHGHTRLLKELVARAVADVNRAMQNGSDTTSSCYCEWENSDHDTSC